MKKDRCRWLIPRVIALQILFFALMMVTGPVLAQKPEPGEPTDALLVQEQESEESTDAQFAVEAASVGSVIPIQGRLTNNSGTPLNGTYTILFSLYDTYVGGTALCSDEDSVTVSNGVFNAYIDYCTSSDINGQRLYLGVKVEGDPEMTPRLAVLPVPYAFSLKPEAIIKGDTDSAILHIENAHESGRGLRAYAMAETGTNWGVVGAVSYTHLRAHET